jgi:hypothetical protein
VNGENGVGGGEARLTAAASSRLPEAELRNLLLWHASRAVSGLSILTL